MGRGRGLGGGSGVRPAQQRDARTRPRKAGSRACAASAAAEATPARAAPRRSTVPFRRLLVALLCTLAALSVHCPLCAQGWVPGAPSGGDFPGPRLLALSTSLTKTPSRCWLGTRWDPARFLRRWGGGALGCGLNARGTARAARGWFGLAFASSRGHPPPCVWLRGQKRGLSVREVWSGLCPDGRAGLA